MTAPLTPDAAAITELANIYHEDCRGLTFGECLIRAEANLQKVYAADHGLARLVAEHDRLAAQVAMLWEALKDLLVRHEDQGTLPDQEASQERARRVLIATRAETA